jgi:hypothetical protein
MLLVVEHQLLLSYSDLDCRSGKFSAAWGEP